MASHCNSRTFWPPISRNSQVLLVRNSSRVFIKLIRLKLQQFSTAFQPIYPFAALVSKFRPRRSSFTSLVAGGEARWGYGLFFLRSSCSSSEAPQALARARLVPALLHLSLAQKERHRSSSYVSSIAT